VINSSRRKRVHADAPPRRVVGAQRIERGGGCAYTVDRDHHVVGRQSGTFRRTVGEDVLQLRSSRSFAPSQLAGGGSDAGCRRDPWHC
jgi:hypothetical protein